MAERPDSNITHGRDHPDAPDPGEFAHPDADIEGIEQEPSPELEEPRGAPGTGTPETDDERVRNTAIDPHEHIPRGEKRYFSGSPKPPGEYSGQSGYGVQGDYTRGGAYGDEMGYGAPGAGGPRGNYAARDYPGREFPTRGGYSAPGGYVGQGGYEDQGRTERSGPGPAFGSPPSMVPQAGYAGQIGYDPRDIRSESRRPRYGPPPKGYRRSSERIREDVCDTIMRNPHIDASEVEVELDDDRTLILKGLVDHRYIKHMIEDIAADILGVEDVDNRIRVRRPGRHASTEE